MIGSGFSDAPQPRHRWLPDVIWQPLIQKPQKRKIKTPKVIAVGFRIR